MYLIINNAILPYFVGLVKGNKISRFLIKGKSEKILSVLEGGLKKSKTKINQIKGIIVVLSPHSFTNLRISLTIGNLLARFLKIPIASVKTDEFRNFKELIEIAKKRLKKKIIIPNYE